MEDSTTELEATLRNDPCGEHRAAIEKELGEMRAACAAARRRPQPPPAFSALQAAAAAVEAAAYALDRVRQFR